MEGVSAPEDVTLATPADVLRVLELAVRAELAQPNSSRRNATLGSLCGTALKACEASELEGRLAALEERLADDGRRAG